MHCTVVDKVIIIVFKGWGAMSGLKATIVTVIGIEVEEQIWSAFQRTFKERLVWAGGIFLKLYAR